MELQALETFSDTIAKIVVPLVQSLLVSVSIR